jgi:peptidyl-prolyl cis-trans isomerase-like 6
MLEFKWAHWLEQKKNELKGETWVFDDVVMVFIDDNLIGSTVQFIQWAIVNYNIEDFRNDDLYETLRREAYAGLLESTKVSCE